MQERGYASELKRADKKYQSFKIKSNECTVFTCLSSIVEMFCNQNLTIKVLFCIENTVSLSIQPENPPIVKINSHMEHKTGDIIICNLPTLYPEIKDNLTKNEG